MVVAAELIAARKKELFHWVVSQKFTVTPMVSPSWGLVLDKETEITSTAASPGRKPENIVKTNPSKPITFRFIGIM